MELSYYRRNQQYSHKGNIAVDKNNQIYQTCAKKFFSKSNLLRPEGQYCIEMGD